VAKYRRVEKERGLGKGTGGTKQIQQSQELWEARISREKEND
jgi:hypothetical protein